MPTDPTLKLLLKQDIRGDAARGAVLRDGLDQKLRLQSIFADIRGEAGSMFRDETYYGDPQGYSRKGMHDA